MLKNIEDLTKKVKQYMPEYLISKGIPLDKSFSCINPAHVHNDYSKVMHYDKENKVLRCFGYCARQSGAGKQGQAFDLLDVIGWDLNTDDFMQKLRYACELYHVGDLAPGNLTKQGKPCFIGSEFLEKSGLLSSVGFFVSCFCSPRATSFGSGGAVFSAPSPRSGEFAHGSR